MKLGLDAKWFFDGPPSGRRVVRGLIGSLCRRQDDTEIHLFLDQRFSSEWRTIGLPRDRQHYIWAGNNQLSNLWNVPRVADRLGLDVVAYQNFAPLRANARHARIALLHGVAFEDNPAYFTKRERLYFSTMRPLARGADRVCAVSASEKERMARLGYAAAERIDVVPHGVDDVFTGDASSHDESARILSALGITSPYVLYVGRLTAGKNVSSIIRAMQHVETEPLTLVVVGESDGTDVDLPQLARQLGAEQRVHFTGAIYDDRLASLYSRASVFCFPTWDESFGLPPLEAMGCGTPCIVSDLPVLREVYGDAAVYTHPGDILALARAIDGLLANGQQVADLCTKGRQRVARYTWDNAADLLVDSARTAAARRS